MSHRTKNQKIFSIFNLILLFVTCLVCILPFVNLLAVSFSSSSAVAARRVTFWPVEFTVEAYRFALLGDKFLQALKISVVRVLLGVTVNMLFVVMSAYPLSRSPRRLHGRNLYMAYFVLTMLIGGGMIPTYLVVVKAGLINSIWALILPGALPVFNMVIFMNFMRGLPVEIDEAAIVDGAGPVMILARILLPLLKPALATIGLFCIVAHWNDWFSGMIYMSSPNKYPLQTYLQSLLKNFEAILRQAGTNYAEMLALMNVQTGRAAQLFLGSIPILLVYPFLQKYFTSGLVLGSVKG